MSVFNIGIVNHCDHPSCELGSVEFDCPSCGRWNKRFELWRYTDSLYDGCKVVCEHCKADLLSLNDPDDGLIILIDDVFPAKTKLCGWCREPKIVGASCVGNDECNYGPKGEAAECCEAWGGRYCCRCGASYARGQI